MRRKVAASRISLPRALVRLCAAVTLCGALAQAQQSEESGNAGADVGASQQPAVSTPKFAPTLNSDSLIALGGRGTYLLFGGTLSTAYYDETVGNLGRGKGIVSIADGHIGLVGQTPEAAYVVQYAGTLMPYSTRHLGNEVLHRASLLLNGNLSPRWDWSFGVFSAYGKEAIRLLGPFGYVAVGGIPTVDSTSAAFQGGNGDVLTSSGSFGLRWRLGEHQSLALSLTHSYFDFINFKQAGPSLPVSSGPINTSSTQLAYERLITSRITFQAFGQATRFFGRPLCTTYGGGVGVSTVLGRSTTLDLSGGPQFNRTSKACGQRTSSGNFSASLVKRWSPTVAGYVTGRREFRATYLAASRWDDDVTLGLSKRGRLAIFLIDSGYLRSALVGSQVIYQGYFASGGVGWNLSPSVSVMATYRRFYSRAGAPVIQANVETLSLVWHPVQVRL